MTPTRRQVLKAGGLTGLAAAGWLIPPWETVDAGLSSLARGGRSPEPFRTRFATPPVLRPDKRTRDPDGTPVEHYTVVERQGVSQVLPGGPPTTVWGYDGLLLGPTIKVLKGHRTVLRVRNHMPATHPTFGYGFTTSTHLHGSPSLPQYDGYASDVSPPGFYKDYHYPNIENAVTYWYHDHAVHHTAQNAYSGLAAQYHLHDADEMRLLPQGEFDVPFTVRDALFARSGELAYDDNSESGLFGDVIVVNGRPWPVMRVKRRVYRFRVLLAAISRSFRFQLGNGDPVTVVATDGGLMPRAQTVTTWRQGTAERYEILIDFAGYRPGERVILRNLSNDNNRDFDNTDLVAAFDVTDAPFDKGDPTWNRIPDRLVDSATMDLTESMAVRSRHLRFERSHGQWTINDKTWQDVIDSNFQQLIADPDLDDIEVWEIENSSGGWFHPVHIHLTNHKILDRNGRPPFDYERGPKDTVYIGENETVRVVLQFGPHRGRYMMHCHNLVHEDHDMMHQFGVGWKPGDPDPNDPLTAAPPKVDDLPRAR